MRSAVVDAAGRARQGLAPRSVLCLEVCHNLGPMFACLGSVSGGSDALLCADLHRATANIAESSKRYISPWAGATSNIAESSKRYISHFVHKGGTLGQLKLSTRRPNSGRCRSQTTSARNDVPRLAAHLLRPTTCPTPSRGRKAEARATTSGTRGRRACGGTTSRTNRTRAERRVSRAPAAATPPPSAANGGRESTRRGATRPSPSRSRQQRLVAWAARPFETARGAVRETSPAGMAHYITRRGLSLVAFWHLLSPRRRLDLAASHHRPLPYSSLYSASGPTIFFMVDVTIFLSATLRDNSREAGWSASSGTPC